MTIVYQVLAFERGWYEFGLSFETGLAETIFHIYFYKYHILFVRYRLKEKKEQD